MVSFGPRNKHLTLGRKYVSFFLYIIDFRLHSNLSQVSVVNALDMQVVVSTVPPTLVEENKDQLIR